MIDLSFKKAKATDKVKTKKGFIWAKTRRGWLDQATGLIWLPIEPQNCTREAAMLKFSTSKKRLPSKVEFEEAEAHGIRELIDMSGRWFWSASVHPNDDDYAYVFSGNYGSVVNRYRYVSNGSVRCVAGR